MSPENVELMHRVVVFPDWRAEPVKVRDLGGVTLATLRLRGHGSGSSVPIDQTIWQVVQWRDGKIVRLSSHDSEDAAREAVGLRE
jgi:hypothetical protein